MPVADRDNRIVKLLASIPRGKLDSQGVPPEEFRVALAEFNGHPYLSLRLFFRAADGEFYPSPGKGCSVRLNEGEDVAAAILEGLRIARERRAADPPASPPRRLFQQPQQRSAPSAPRETRASSPREVQTNALDDLAEYRR